jgi:hypothetical protein
MNDNIKTPKTSITGSLTENRIIAPIALGIAILVSILVTRPLYMSYIESSDKETKAMYQYEALSSEYEKLLSIKNNSSGGLSEVEKQKIEKISKNYDRSTVMETMLLSQHTRDTADTPASISIGSVTLSDPTKLPNGLMLTRASISLRGNTVDKIIDYITYLTTETPYAFTIEEISLPIDTAPEGEIPTGYSLSLSLGIYSYE